MSQSRKHLCRVILTLAVLFLSANWNGPVAVAQSSTAQNYKELFERSEKEKKGLTFYVRGQTISGVVVKVGSDAVEVRNQISAGSSFDWTALTLWR